MKRAVSILGIICGLLISISASPQDIVTYSYDAAGNRTGRTGTTQRQSRRIEKDSLFPVASPKGIDSISHKHLFFPVEVDPENIPLSLSEEEKQTLNESFFNNQRAEEQAWWEEYTGRSNPRSVDTTCSVGAIPLQDGISPSGARTYSLSIPTAAGFKLVPNISLAYNSQAAEGWAGYGWDIQGISCIRLIGKNTYYHGTIKAADVTATDPVFALDGVPLVTNEHPATSSAYPLETARGHILAAMEVNAYGRATKFTVLYPNGIRAVYGRNHNHDYNLAFYHLAEMQDAEGGKISFIYSLDGAAGHDCPTAIRYGYDSSGNYCGEITFTYATWADCPTRYFAGKAVKFNKRLVSIESRSDNAVLATYNFSYQQSSPLWQLDRIDCSSGTASLPPVEFSYSTIPASQYLKKDNRSITLDQSFFVYGRDNVYKRGKFVKNEYRDGILIYPGLSPYTYLYGGGYGSEFNPQQKIIFIPRLEKSNTVNSTSLACGDGFQTMDAVDTDGDGVDEIVRVNMPGRQGNFTKYSITVYECDDNGTPVQDYTFDILLNGVAGPQPYPYHRTFRWGDFNGDGKAELLAVAYSSNYPGNYTQNCYTALIDIESQTVLSDEVLFNNYYYNGSKSLIVCDIDNDGRTELCYATSTGFSIFRLQPNGHFALENTLSSPTYDVFVNPNCPSYLADINGDGYLDIAHASASYSTPSSWTFYYYNGRSFSTRTVTLAQPSSYTDAMFLDVNRDGMADLVTINETSDTTATLGTYINQNGHSFSAYQESPDDVKDAKGIVPVNVSAYNKPSAFMKFDGLTVYNYSYSGITAATRHILSVSDSFGKKLRNNYAYLPSNAPTWSDNSLTVNNSQGFVFHTLPLYVLSSEYDYASSSYSSFYTVNEYEYYNGVVHNRGLGFCGFSRIRTKELITVAQSYTRSVSDVYYEPEKMGVVKKVVRKIGTGAGNPAYYTQTNTWDSHSTTYGKLSPRLTQSSLTDALTGVYTLTYYTYDTWDFPTSIRSLRRISGHPDQIERHAYTYQHSNTASKYVLGSVTREEEWQDLDGQLLRQWKKKSIYSLDTLFRPLSRQDFRGLSLAPAATPFAELADSTLFVGETRWTYDTHGNVTSEKSAPYGAAEFIGRTYTYDSNGRYLLSDTDALGRATTYANYNKFGKPGTVTDFRNRSTHYSYDAWGNETAVVRIDESTGLTKRAWGGEGVYTITRTEAYGGPVSVSHYDGLGREIRTGSKRFDGQWQFTDTRYDRYGRVSRTSLPFRGTEPAYWNTYSYDNHDRPVKITSPSGKETAWSYSGTSVCTVRDGVVSTSTKDASGFVVSVQDAGGTITYSLRDDGQPSRITAPGNVETTFTYDGYGRRTSMSDPSAGIRTEAYVWNADGSHEQTSTGPNGSISTSWDKYGRATSVQRPGAFNTTYTYDGYGLLTSVQSTNGTGVEYTYDEADCLSTVKETVPDGKWLKKTYTYGSWGNVSSVKYTTREGDITTEWYAYADGHRTGVSITGGTTVWSLVSENDLGAPTEVTTGSISRQYGFTDFGLPTYRKMAGGTLQNYTYQFNAGNGNLTSRSDLLNNRTETFGYDALNRLDTLGTRVFNYANNGNILTAGGVGSMTYGNASAPYQVTGLAPASSDLVPGRTQVISYNSLDRPSLLEEGGKTASFIYNGAGNRVKMTVADGQMQQRVRYYIGDRYECDSTSTGTRERLYVGGDAYSAPMVLQRDSGGSWTAYNIGRDYLGSITHIATTGGTPVAEYSYDPWGRLRNPATHAIYAPGSEPELFLGRGFTGHEHLSWFGLINMNARLYDPLLGRFLSPDPYVQAPDFTQNFNRYSYALNNPLRFTDEDGEWLHLLFGAILGGAGNLIANWNNCDGFWEYFVSFTVGAAAGTAVAATGGAAAGGGFWATAGVIGVGATGGAVSGAAGDIIRQTGENFAGIDNLDWNSVGISAAAGGVSGAASAGVGVAMSGVHIPVTVNGTTIESPILSSYIAGAATGATGHIAGGTIAGVLWGDSFDTALGNSLEGIGTSILLGGAFSTASIAAYCIADGVNPLNGEQLSLRILPSAKSLGLESEVKRITDGTNYPQFRHDGTTFSNREGLLPGGVTYKEYVVPPISGYGPGANRIVVGSDNTWYYTPDHYKTFVRFKP